MLADTFLVGVRLEGIAIRLVCRSVGASPIILRVEFVGGGHRGGEAFDAFGIVVQSYLGAGPDAPQLGVGIGGHTSVGYVGVTLGFVDVLCVGDEHDHLEGDRLLLQCSVREEVSGLHR